MTRSEREKETVETEVERLSLGVNHSVPSGLTSSIISLHLRIPALRYAPRSTSAHFARLRPLRGVRREE